MLARINKISNFGVYQNYRHSAAVTQDFKKYNLIYGWNYSGKTTLSRALRCLEKSALHPDYASATYEFDQSSGQPITQTVATHGLNIRVFNKDFIAENFHEETKATSVFIVGGNAIALKQKLQRLEDLRTKNAAREAGIENKIPKAQGTINKSQQNIAKQISESIADKTYNKTHLERTLREIANQPCTQTEPEVEALRIKCLSTENKPEISKISIDADAIDQLFLEINALLTQTASNAAIQKLKSDPSLENWIRTGRVLHKDATECLYCGNKIPEAITRQLEGHFSSAYENLISSVKSKITEIDRSPVFPCTIKSVEFHQDMQAAVGVLITQLNDAIKIASEKLSTAKNALTEKIAQAETALPPLDIKPELSALSAAAQALSEAIDRHNLRSRNFTQERETAKSTLKNHLASTHNADPDVIAAKSEIHSQAKTKTHCTRFDKKLSALIAATNVEIKRNSIGLTKLKENIRQILSDSQIDITETTDGYFEFQRSGVKAKNLSEGERTAISFAYYLTKLEEGGTPLANTIVFIDDPISSLDSNHIFSVYAIIRERLAACAQLFVSTHNSEFFGLIKDWLKETLRGTPNLPHSLYYVQKNTVNSESSLINLPDLLKKHKSEYQFLFSCLKAIKNSAGTPPPHEVYSAPIILRKFLEAYLGFKQPDGSAWGDKLELIIQDPVKRKEIYKFTNEHSHAHNSTRIMQIPIFLAMAQPLIRDVFTGMQTHDNHHFTTLDSIS